MVVWRCCKVTECALPLAEGVPEQVTLFNKPLHRKREFFRDMGKGGGLWRPVLMRRGHLGYGQQCPFHRRSSSARTLYFFPRTFPGM